MSRRRLGHGRKQLTRHWGGRQTAHNRPHDSTRKLAKLATVCLGIERRTRRRNSFQRQLLCLVYSSNHVTQQYVGEVHFWALGQRKKTAVWKRNVETLLSPRERIQWQPCHERNARHFKSTAQEFGVPHIHSWNRPPPNHDLKTRPWYSETSQLVLAPTRATSELISSSSSSSGLSSIWSSTSK